MYNSNTDSLGLILDVEVFFSLGHCSGALCCVSYPSDTFGHEGTQAKINVKLD